MTPQEVRQSAEQKMTRSLDSLKNSLGKIRTGRAHPGLLEGLQVDYYGNPTPLSQVANLTLIDARTIGVAPWEKKMVAVVEKAIRESDLGLNPASSGDLIRVPMPALTEERRRELTKVVRTEGEESKVSIRNARRDANDQLKKAVKDKLISEDDERRAQEEIQRLTDKFVADIDKLLAQKEAEVMTV
ncbi:MAG: ribosome recycling factor [Betaproteobacteria bacterium]|nr:ribosome recycling factor [Betaproteobacteria bacterium]NBT74492.1 ribosome recycling factor [Betaproteobacteria bacterium]NBY13764.1 ribosome recycling factor [Betaproteobacteria bacterium]NCA15535.1 ribosome recycling factor [Betaproteobacteria bacterium]